MAVWVPDREYNFGSGCHKGMDIDWGERLKWAVGNISEAGSIQRADIPR